MPANYRLTPEYIKSEIRFLADTNGAWWSRHGLTMVDRALALDEAMDALAMVTLAESQPRP